LCHARHKHKPIWKSGWAVAMSVCGSTLVDMHGAFWVLCPLLGSQPSLKLCSCCAAARPYCSCLDGLCVCALG
jgi:hypothetical protein